MSAPNVLANRYASSQMRAIWGQENKIIAERRLWITIMEAQAELGVGFGGEDPATVIADYQAVVEDVTAGRYTDVHLAAFLTASAALPLDEQETVDLTAAMIDAGERLTWNAPVVVDKHCIGGIPGNRTSMLVVPIVAAPGEGDIGVGATAWLNIVAILFLQAPALKCLWDYRRQKKAGLDPQFDPEALGIRNADFWKTKA